MTLEFVKYKEDTAINVPACMSRRFSVKKCQLGRNKKLCACESINDHDYHVWNENCELNASSNISSQLKLTWKRYENVLGLHTACTSGTTGEAATHKHTAENMR